MIAGSGPKTPLVAVLGARLARDGSPTPVLEARIEAALAAGRKESGCLYLASGAPERQGVSEAQAIAVSLGAAGIEPCSILIDVHSMDTFEQIRRIATFHVRHARTIGPVILATSRFHAPRCRLLAKLFGLDVRVAPAVPDRTHFSRSAYFRRLFFEGLSLVHDTGLAVVLRLTDRWPLEPCFERLPEIASRTASQS